MSEQKGKVSLLCAQRFYHSVMYCIILLHIVAEGEKKMKIAEAYIESKQSVIIGVNRSTLRRDKRELRQSLTV